jgi:hypothetical protein
MGGETLQTTSEVAVEVYEVLLGRNERLRRKEEGGREICSSAVD